MSITRWSVNVSKSGGRLPEAVPASGIPPRPLTRRPVLVRTEHVKRDFADINWRAPFRLLLPFMATPRYVPATAFLDRVVRLCSHIPSRRSEAVNPRLATMLNRWES